MKSLQDKYNLIKEGKGNKELFLKEARTMFPNVVTNVLTFDQAIHNLSERGIISEATVFGGIAQPKTPDWFKIFNENVKSDLKQTDREVEEMEIKGYDYKDTKNSNNISTAEILSGYYAEMKDPKNAEKTEEELKKIVFKNLEKDPMYYIKDGAFGVKGIGYTEDAPGLGKPKEVTGKYKSSGMEPVKLNEAKRISYDQALDLRAEKAEIEDEIKQVRIDMEEEGDESKANYYGRILNRLDSKLAKVKKQLEDYDMNESLEETLTESKRKAVEKHLKEIEKLGEVAAVAHKIEKITEKIEELKNKLTMTEGDDVKEMVDKKAVKELQKDIKLYERKKAFYEKMHSKLSKKAGISNIEEEAPIMEEEEKQTTPQRDPETDRVFKAMKRDVSTKVRSWEEIVKDLLKDKVPGTSK